MNRPSTHSSFQKPLIVSSTGGVTQTAAGLAAFGRRSAGGVPNVGSEAISKHQQNPPPHQQQQQHVDPGEQTSTEKEEEEEDVGLSYVHKDILNIYDNEESFVRTKDENIAVVVDGKLYCINNNM